ncbi:hypothetical protein A3Q56_06569 [Intoshia linei]|uniref:phosphatidylserine decarboxylase n=1 Tax=Intoshia linei TaxID=1819745 RepID=A0A177AUN6_9BILA|nr:hypothetical protein A3Q56_06569 [Intoshia linei]
MVFRKRLVMISSLFTGYYLFKNRYLDTDKRGLKISFYRLLPLRSLSQIWGKINSLNLYPCIRKPLLSAYINFYNVKLQEAVNCNLEFYESISHFFERDIHSYLRPVCTDFDLISPCDGKITHCGQIDVIETNIDAKGFKCSLNSLIGKDIVEKYNLKSKRLYYITIYLDPGDYHGIHSPATWKILERRHIPGELFSVHPKVTNLMPKIFSLNERAVYVGSYSQGFMGLVAIGATCVGSITVYGDKKLKTNVKTQNPNSAPIDELFNSENIIMQRIGEKFGHFSLGSSIVLLFESKEDVAFNPAFETNKINYGQSFLLK